MPRPPPEYPSRDAYTTRAATHDDDALLDAPTALDPPRMTDEILATWPDDEPAADDVEGSHASLGPIERRPARTAVWWLGLGLVLGGGASALGWVLWRWVA